LEGRQRREKKKRERKRERKKKKGYRTKVLTHTSFASATITHGE